jgi:hypothetical protein
MPEQTNIPKIIHYCWFGGNPLPESAQKYIESWKKHCPDYVIKEWNESNFDLTSNAYVQEAFEAKKWAFITDYVRLHAMVTEGGIYMDTDVEVTKPLDEFLQLRAFSGFEDGESVPTGIMACEKGFPLFAEMLHDYDNRHFKLEDGSYDITTNVVTITDICKKKGLVSNNQKQTIEGFTIFPKDWFCPKDWTSGKIVLTKNTHAIHHFSGSWHDPYTRRIMSVERFFKGKLKGKPGNAAARIASLPFRVHKKLHELGLKGTIAFTFRKLKGEKSSDGRHVKTKL